MFLPAARLNGRHNIWIRKRATFWWEREVIRRCISSWISVVMTKPPIARTTRKKTSNTFFRMCCRQPDLNRCNAESTYKCSHRHHLDIPSSGLVEYQRSAHCSPRSTMINEKFSPCSSNPELPSIFARSVSPNEKQASNVLNPVVTTLQLNLRQIITI